MNTYSHANLHPCAAVRDGDWVVIAIHKDTIKNAVEFNPELEHYDEASGDYIPARITDLDKFVDDLVDELNREEEDGGTLITTAFDRASVNACENGSDAILIGDE